MGLSHPKSAQQSLVGPSTSSINIPVVQATPLLPQNTVMIAWYAPLVLPQPLVPLPNEYQSKIPHFTGTESTTTQHHVDKMNDAFDYM